MASDQRSAARRFAAPRFAAPWFQALSPRRELAGVLILGAVGAGLVLLASRQTWAQVRTPVPAPLPASVVTVSGQGLVPFAAALAIAALASLAAVLATRGIARRAVGVLLAGLGIAVAAAAVAGVSASAALAAAAGSLGPGTGAGSGAGSVTEGGAAAGGPAAPDVAGFHSHVVLTAAGWQAMAVAGGLAICAAGVLVFWRGTRLPVMSSRYDSPSGTPVRTATTAGVSGRPATSDSASMWESLSRGEDPT